MDTKSASSAASASRHSAHTIRCARSAEDAATPAAVSFSASLYCSQDIAISPLTAYGRQTISTSRFRAEAAAFPLLPQVCVLPSPREAARAAIFPAAPRRRGRDGPEIHRRRRDPPRWEARDAARDGTTAIRAARGVWRNALGLAPAEM